MASLAWKAARRRTVGARGPHADAAGAVAATGYWPGTQRRPLRCAGPGSPGFGGSGSREGGG